MMSGEMQTREQMLAGLATPCAAVEGAGSEAMRAAIDAGLRAFCSDTSDFTMSSAMRRAAADFIMGQPGMFTTPPARTYAEGVEDAAKVADDYEQHTGDPAFDAATDVAAVTIGERIRLLSQGEKA